MYFKSMVGIVIIGTRMAYYKLRNSNLSGRYTDPSNVRTNRYKNLFFLFHSYGNFCLLLLCNMYYIIIINYILYTYIGTLAPV